MPTVKVKCRPRPFTVQIVRTALIGDGCFEDSSKTKARSVVAIKGPMAEDEHLLIVSAITSSSEDDQGCYLAAVSGNESKIEISDASVEGASVRIQVCGGRLETESTELQEKPLPSVKDAITALATELGLIPSPKEDGLINDYATNELRTQLINKLAQARDWCTAYDALCRSFKPLQLKKSSNELWLLNVFWTLAGIIEADRRAPLKVENWELRRIVLNRMCDLEWLSRNAVGKGRKRTSKTPPSQSPELSNTDERPSPS
jgi:hypothetical protein